MPRSVNNDLALARREFRGARTKVVKAVVAAKDGLLEEGGAIAKWIKSGKGSTAFGQALSVITKSFNEHRADVLGTAKKK